MNHSQDPSLSALRRQRPRLRFCTALAAGALLLVDFSHNPPLPLRAADDDKPATLSTKWSVLYLAKKTEKGTVPLPDDFPVKVLKDFALKGPGPADPNRIGDFKAAGEWAVVDGWLQRTQGTDTALQLGRATSFEMEGIVNAEGLGGWFFLLGWNNDHGYIIYNVTLKSSGSPWIIAEFRNGKGIDNTHREFTRFAWKGDQPLRMTVADQKLTIQVGETLVADELQLPNYDEGDIILGTYKTQYGPKPVKIRSLRIRAK